MPATIHASARRRVQLCLLASFGLAITAPMASAQPGYGRYDDDRNASTFGDVIVTAPRSMQRHSATGAPIEWVSSSRRVRYGDLDLSRRWGVRELHTRVARAARAACDDLDASYPITAPDSPPACATRSDTRWPAPPWAATPTRTGDGAQSWDTPGVGAQPIVTDTGVDAIPLAMTTSVAAPGSADVGTSKFVDTGVAPVATPIVL